MFHILGRRATGNRQPSATRSNGLSPGNHRIDPAGRFPGPAPAVGATCMSPFLLDERTHIMPPTGPRTPVGKAISSRNATRHGLLSNSVLATPHESKEEWQAHREGILDDLQPRGQA